MNKYILLSTLTLVLLTTFSGCAVVGDIFKTGMGVGIFLTVLVIGFVFYLIYRLFKK